MSSDGSCHTVLIRDMRFYFLFGFLADEDRSNVGVCLRRKRPDKVAFLGVRCIILFCILQILCISNRTPFCVCETLIDCYQTDL
jgi:hypothetical protein